MAARDDVASKARDDVATKARDDVATVCAIAVIAMCVATAAHEAVGHGSACLALGGRITQLTSVYFQCSLTRGVAVAGPAGNFAAGLLGFVVFGVLPARATRARLFALLVLAFSLFWGAGYMVYSAVLNDGDYAFAARDILGSPAWWRIAAVALGIVLYAGANRIVTALARQALGERAQAVFRTALIAATAAAVIAALLYAPDRVAAAWQGALEIGVASFALALPRKITGGDAPAIDRSWAWIASAVVVFAVFAATLGRGLP